MTFAMMSLTAPEAVAETGAPQVGPTVATGGAIDAVMPWAWLFCVALLTLGGTVIRRRVMRMR